MFLIYKFNIQMFNAYTTIMSYNQIHIFEK